ncbi:hypothetical protein RDI58_006738 [Solanum bulbocastanum]|uniref:Transmembrane protein n=1 Tax=Solanum bulbocastanum TaxID=147425 RepID=A0AAN8YHX1_SOLBU
MHSCCSRGQIHKCCMALELNCSSRRSFVMCVNGSVLRFTPKMYFQYHSISSSSFLSMGVDLRMNLSLFLTLFVSSILFLFIFHIIGFGILALLLAWWERGLRT